MSRYYDYFEEQSHTAGEVTIDEFIAEAMRTDLKFNTLAEELQYQRVSRITLINELLTCYQCKRQIARLGQLAFLCDTLKDTKKLVVF